MRRWTDRLLILLFAAALAAPAALSLVREPDIQSLARENRSPATFPAITGSADSVKKFPNRFDAWFNDRLAFRDTLLQWHAAWKVRQLGVSSSDKVILGRDGWLFLDEERASAASRSRLPAEQAELWLSAMRKRRDWLAERGIDYLVVITPEKHSIYPEFLPASLQHPHPPTAVDHLLAKVRAAGGLEILDLRPALLQAKMNQPLYFRTDTHWNDEGAFVAYRVIMHRLAERRPELQPLPRHDFDAVSQPHHGDLLQMLHLPDAPPEKTTRLQLRSPRARRLPDAVPLDPHLHSPQYLPPQAWGRRDCKLPRAILFHDSFGERLMLPLLAEHFSFLAYVPTASFIPDLVEQFRPQIVIQQIVARKINWHPPVHPRGF